MLRAARISSSRAGSLATARLAESSRTRDGRDVVSRLGRIEVGLRGEAAAEQVLAAVERALRVVLLHLRRLEARVDGRDLLGPAAIENVGEFGLRLAERRFGVVDGDFGVGRLQRRDPVARLQLVAAANVFGRDARDLDRRDIHVFAFDIADGGVGRGRAGGQDPGDQRERADRFEESWGFFPVRDRGRRRDCRQRDA